MIGLAVLVAAAALAVPATSAAARASESARDIARPRIIQKPIPFNAKRKRQMAAYSKRHYGQHTYKLTDPKVIVEHYTAGPSMISAWNTFASNRRDIGELPGVCAHFIIDKRGKIFQVVDLSIRCRHTVGLNWTAIGIEHVGMSDGEILHNRRMMRASTRLTAWLMQRYHINIGNVIGHNESLHSRYRRELYRDPAWRCQTHSDWNHHDMTKYRRRLRDVLKNHNIAAGKGYDPVPVPSGC